MRLRIFFGTLILIVGLGLYALAGVAWVFPAARLTGWMQRARPFRPPELG